MNLRPTLSLRSWTCLIAATLSLILPPTAHAHPEGFSGLKIVIEPSAVKLEATLHTRDLDNWFPPRLFPDYVEGVCRGFEQQAGDLYEVQLNYVPAARATPVKAFLVEPGLIQVDLRFPYDGPLEMVKVEFLQFRKLPREHQQYIVIIDDRGALFGVPPDPLLIDTVDADQPASAKEIPPSRWPASGPATAPGTGPAATPTIPADAAGPPAMETRVHFFLDGIEHILFGYDHLLFIAALLLACRTFREAATIVTFFTLAHSITLALSAMRLVNISGDIIEPAIAATILIVAVENLAHRPKLAWRCAVTLFFGAIHGLGFAKDLREKLASENFADIVMPLIKFSAGVETGHLALVAIALPFLLWAKRREPRFDTVAVPALSLVISLFGGFWLVTRVWQTMHG